jgi:hypothetical protein
MSGRGVAKMSDIHRRLLVIGLGLVSSAATACADPEPAGPAASRRFWQEIQPHFWESLDYDNPDKLARLSAFVSDFNAVASGLERALDAGTITAAAEREDAGRILFYFGHMLDSNVFVVLEKRITVADLVAAAHFSDTPASSPDFEQEELKAQITRSVSTLEKAVQLRGADRRPKVALLAARTIQDRVLYGHTRDETVRDLVGYGIDTSDQAIEQRKLLGSGGPGCHCSGAPPNFDLMVALLAMRDVEDANFQFVGRDDQGAPAVRDYMLQLLATVARRVTPEAVPGFDEATGDALAKFPFVAITGPLLRSDYFVRYTYELWKAKLYDDARLQIALARAPLRLIRDRLAPLLELYPLKNIVEKREDFLARLEAAVAEGDPISADSLNLSMKDLFQRRDFKAPYLCANCHANH